MARGNPRPPNREACCPTPTTLQQAIHRLRRRAALPGLETLLKKGTLGRRRAPNLRQRLPRSAPVQGHRCTSVWSSAGRPAKREPAGWPTSPNRRLAFTGLNFTGSAVGLGVGTQGAAGCFVFCLKSGRSDLSLAGSEYHRQHPTRDACYLLLSRETCSCPQAQASSEPCCVLTDFITTLQRA